MAVKVKNIICFGEVLWDVFPAHKKIGGAPLNVALRLGSFGNKVAIISGVGEDIPGEEIIQYLEKHDIDTHYIQHDKDYKTGEVTVNLDTKESASYTIDSPVAWDMIEVTQGATEAVSNCDAFIFGSLAIRHKTSQDTLSKLLDVAHYKIFDVNLRTPYYSKEGLSTLLYKADFVKFNEEELQEIGHLFGLRVNTIEDGMRDFQEQFTLDRICITKGKAGAILLDGDTFYYNNGYIVEVKDTVGAGDSFLATLIHFLFHTKNPQDAIDVACAVGALVAGREGANPEISEDEIKDFINTQ